jgi:hypothetical protein
MQRIRALGWLATMGLVAACGSDDGIAVNEQMSTELTLLEGPEVVRCWAEKGEGADDVFRTDTVFCQLHEAPEYPLDLSLGSIDSHTKDGKFAGAFFEDLGGEAHVVQRVGYKAYPIEIIVRVSARAVDPRVLGVRDSLAAIETKLTIAAPDAEPVAVRFPLDVWPIEVVGREVDLPYAALGRFSADVSPFTLANGKSALELSGGSMRVELGRSERYFVPVGRGATAVTGEAQLAEGPVAFELTGPGRYLATSKGLTATKPGETLPVSKGEEIARCWVDKAEGAAGATISCSAAATMTGVRAIAIDATLPETSAALPLDGTPIALAEVDPATFPREVQLRASFESEAQGFRGDFIGTPLELTLTLGGEGAPVTAQLPFDVWSIELTAGADTQLVFAELDDYLVQLNAPWAGLSTLSIHEQLGDLQPGATQTLLFVADSNLEAITGKGAVLVNQSDIVDVELALRRGGKYRVGKDGFVAQ